MAADLAAAAWVDDRVEAQVVAKTSGAVGVEADIGSFGWLPRLLLTGEVRESSVTLEQVRGGEVRFSDVRLRLTSTEVDRSALLGGDVEIRSVRRARLEFSLAAEELARVTGLQVTADDGAVSVTVRGRTVRAELEMSSEGSLVLRVPPLPVVTVPLPDLPLVPCQPDVEAVDGAVRFTCTLSPVPPQLLELLSRRQASTS